MSGTCFTSREDRVMANSKLPDIARRLAALICVILLFAGAGYLAYRFTHDHERYDRRKDAIKYVVLGIANYAAGHRSLPPLAVFDNDHEPLASWRFEMLNFVDAGRPEVLSGRWDNPANRRWNEQAHWLYCFDGDRSTNLMAVTGMGSPFEAPWRDNLETLDFDTILLVEVKDSRIHWMEPGDFPLDQLLRMDEDAPAGRIFGVGPEGFHVAFWDAEVWFLSSRTPVGVLRHFVTVDGAAKHDREALLSKFRIE